MTSEDRPRKRWRRDGGCGCGCGGFFFVLTVGILLSLFNLIVSVGLSVRVPFTDSNLTVAGSVGTKGAAVGALPSYTQGRLGSNQNLINGSTTITIGPAEGASLVVLGRQPGAPAVDLHIVLR